MKRWFLSIASVISISFLAHASQIFTWTDDEDVIHYTDDPSKVPTKYKVQKLDGPQVNEIVGDDDEGKSPGADNPSMNSTEDKTNEKHWRKRFRDALALIQSLEKKISEDKARVQDPSGLPVLYKGKQYSNGRNTIVVGDPQFIETKRRLAQNERLLQRAKAALENLEREASDEAIPREWRVP